MASLANKLQRRRSNRTTLIVVGVLGTLVIVGVALALAGGGGSSALPPSQPTTLIRPGYTIGPNCGALTINDEAKAVAFARATAKSTPAAPGWDDAVSLKIFGPACSAVSAQSYVAAVKAHGPFMYRMLRGVIQGGYDQGAVSEDQGQATLDQLRQVIATGAGVDIGTLTPVKLLTE